MLNAHKRMCRVWLCFVHWAHTYDTRMISLTASDILLEIWMRNADGWEREKDRHPVPWGQQRQIIESCDYTQHQTNQGDIYTTRCTAYTIDMNFATSNTIATTRLPHKREELKANEWPRARKCVLSVLCARNEIRFELIRNSQGTRKRGICIDSPATIPVFRVDTHTVWWPRWRCMTRWHMVLISLLYCGKTLSRAAVQLSSWHLSGHFCLVVSLWFPTRLPNANDSFTHTHTLSHTFKRKSRRKNIWSSCTRITFHLFGSIAQIIAQNVIFFVVQLRAQHACMRRRLDCPCFDSKFLDIFVNCVTNFGQYAKPMEYQSSTYAKRTNQQCVGHHFSHRGREKKILLESSKQMEEITHFILFWFIFHMVARAVPIFLNTCNARQASKQASKYNQQNVIINCFVCSARACISSRQNTTGIFWME